MNPQQRRELVVSFIGLAGLINEGFVKSMGDPSLLVFWAALIGLPAFTTAYRNGKSDA